MHFLWSIFYGLTFENITGTLLRRSVGDAAKFSSGVTSVELITHADFAFIYLIIGPQPLLLDRRTMEKNRISL